MFDIAVFLQGTFFWGEDVADGTESEGKRAGKSAAIQQSLQKAFEHAGQCYEKENEKTTQSKEKGIQSRATWEVGYSLSKI